MIKSSSNQFIIKEFVLAQMKMSFILLLIKDLSFSRRKKLLNPNMNLELVNLWADNRQHEELVTNDDAQLNYANISKISNKLNENLSPFNDKIINMLKLNRK